MTWSSLISVYCANTRCSNYKGLTGMGVFEQFMEAILCGNVDHMDYHDHQAD
jgi:hypothetical protein